MQVDDIMYSRLVHKAVCDITVGDEEEQESWYSLGRTDLEELEHSCHGHT